MLLMHREKLLHFKISPLVAMHITFESPSKLPDGVSINAVLDISTQPLK
jgi:hypothetical protein